MNLETRIGKLEQAQSVEVCTQCKQSPGAHRDVAAAVRDALADPHVVSCKPTSALQVTEMTGQSFWVSDESRACQKKDKTAGISPTGGLVFSLNLFGGLEEGETILAST
jgi:hypothetical protein